jgi:hypothetical protein
MSQFRLTPYCHFGRVSIGCPWRHWALPLMVSVFPNAVYVQVLRIEIIVERG